MQDVVHVILSYATRHHAIVDRDVIRNFLHRFMPWLFGLYGIPELQPSSSASSSSFSNTINNDTTTSSSSPSQQQPAAIASYPYPSLQPIDVLAQLPSSSQHQQQQYFYHLTPTSPSSSSTTHSTAFPSNHTLHDHHRPIYLNHATPLATPPSSDHVDFDIDDDLKQPLVILDNSDDESLGQRSTYSRSSSPISFSPPGTSGTTFESPYRTGYPKSTCLFCNDDFYCFIRYYQASNMTQYKPIPLAN